jgi:hypothetical protein
VVDSGRDRPEEIEAAVRELACGHTHWSPALREAAAPAGALGQRPCAPTAELLALHPAAARYAAARERLRAAARRGEPPPLVYSP